MNMEEMIFGGAISAEKNSARPTGSRATEEERDCFSKLPVYAFQKADLD